MLIISFGIRIFRVVIDIFYLRRNLNLHYKNIHFRITTKLRVIHIFAIQMTLTCIAHIER